MQQEDEVQLLFEFIWKRFCLLLKESGWWGGRMSERGEGKAPIKFCSAHAYEEAKVKNVWEME